MKDWIGLVSSDVGALRCLTRYRVDGWRVGEPYSVKVLAINEERAREEAINLWDFYDILKVELITVNNL